MKRKVEVVWKVVQKASMQITVLHLFPKITLQVVKCQTRDEFVKSFVQDAISKVVQPLSEAWGDEDLEENEEAQVVEKMVARLEDDW